ncbi:ankyrin repeat-containing domain protein [Xylaria cubensis]|nr:ankyrin repeat-containing domain protein [Xylaria cubensis]
MASLGKLPVETALQVLQDLGIRDLAAFAATCRGYYELANPLLYKLEAQDIRSYAFFDAAGSGNVGLMRKLVDAGFDVNRQWRSAFPGPRFEKIRILSRWYKGRCSRTEVVRHYQTESKRHAKATQTRYQSTDHQVGDYIEEAETDSDYEEDVPPYKSEVPDLIVENYDFNSSCSLGSSGNLGAMNFNHWTALHLAVANGQNNVVSFLINKGADINAPSTGYCECSQIRAYISEYPEDDDPLPVWSPLHMAICRGYFQTAKLLLIRGASTVVEVDKLGSPQNRSRCTALHLACYHGPYRLVTTLIKDGYQSDLEVQDGLQQTPFVYAFCAQQFDRIIPYLKRKGCDINTTLGTYSNRSTGTCLIIACRASQYEDAIRLVELGVDVNSVELQTDNSPLHICAKLLTSMFRATRVGYHQLGAAAKRRHQLARELLKAGASLTSLNRDGRTPLDLATTHLDGQMTKFFMEYKDITDSEIGEIGEPSRLS